jgi:hypothetical protein
MAAEKSTTDVALSENKKKYDRCRTFAEGCSAWDVNPVDRFKFDFYRRRSESEENNERGLSLLVNHFVSHATVDDKVLAGDKACCIRNQKADELSNILGLTSLPISIDDGDAPTFVQ